MGERPVDSARSWAVACHLAALAGMWVPLGHLLGPLVIWLAKRNDDPFIDAQGKEAVNFQLSATLYGAAFVLLLIVLLLPVGVVEGMMGMELGPRTSAFLWMVLAGLLAAAASLAWLVLVIVAAVRASRGEDYRYPLTLRLVR